MQEQPTESPRLIVLRGNSGSGKSTTATALRDTVEGRLAWVEQDYFRRVILREAGDEPDPAAAGLIEDVVVGSMSRGFDVVLDGILDARRYGPALSALHERYGARSWFYYFAVPLQETVRRHASRPIADEFGEDELRSWFRESDSLPFVDERVIGAGDSLERTVGRILGEVGLEASGRVDPSTTVEDVTRGALRRLEG